MLSVEEAKQKAASYPGVASVEAAVLYHSVYVVRVRLSAEDEQDYDPFLSVDSATGEVKEFSFLTDGDPIEITMLFLAEED